MFFYLLLGACGSSCAGTCNPGKPEVFEAFFSIFKSDRKFAVSRTQYPLKFVRIDLDEHGLETGLPPTVLLISQESDAGSPSLADYMKENQMEAKTLSLTQAEAIVQVGMNGSG
ncbi:MAG: hypothetical protein WC474_03620 [Hydrogenophilaceae bacterium]